MESEPWEKISDEQKRLCWPHVLLPAPSGAERLIHKPRPKSAQASVSLAITGAQMGCIRAWWFKEWVKCLTVGKDRGNCGWHCTKIPLFPSTAAPGVKSIDSYAGLLKGRIIATAPLPWKMGLSFHFVSLFHLRKFRERMFLLFSPLDIISYAVSESAQWELGAGKQITGAAV